MDYAYGVSECRLPIRKKWVIEGRPLEGDAEKKNSAFGAKLGPKVVLTSSTFWPLPSGGGGVRVWARLPPTHPPINTRCADPGTAMHTAAGQQKPQPQALWSHCHRCR